MARNHIVIDAPPDAVYDVLTDAHAYPEWVVGAKAIRGVDRGWPRTGTRMHHKVGAGLLDIEDETRIVGKRRHRRVELEVKIRPVGIGHVVLDLKPKAGGRRTKVTMTERLTDGPAGHLWNPVLSAAIRVRNAISLRRLRRLVASRNGRR